MKTNYFENCKTTEELKATYKELVKKYHPDVFGKDGNEIMKEIHNQMEKALKRVDSKLYNEIYNGTDKAETEETRAKKEQIAKGLFEKCGNVAYQYLFIAYLQNGLRPYNHRNPLTKHNFSGWNVWQLELKALTEGFKSAEWSTFAQLKANKQTVAKGQHGAYITLAIVSKSKKDDETEEEEKPSIYYKGYTVFNMEQTKENVIANSEVKQIETSKPAENKQTILNLWSEKYEVVA
jgi:hypothetical protein